MEAHPDTVTFYSRINGCKYYFVNGESATFTNGIYVTDDVTKIAELQKLCKQHANHMIYDHPVELQELPRDMVIPKSVDQTEKSGTTNILSPQTVKGVGSSLTPHQLEQLQKAAAASQAAQEAKKG